MDSVSVGFVELEDPSASPGDLPFKTQWIKTDGDTVTYKIAYWSDITLNDRPHGVEAISDISQTLKVDGENAIGILVSDTIALSGVHIKPTLYRSVLAG